MDHLPAAADDGVDIMNEHREKAFDRGAESTPIKVLLADDSPIMTRALVNFLQALDGIDVAGVVFDGRQAVEKAAEITPDLVLLDLRMPRMDGLAAAAEIREALPEARIVLMSLHDQEAIRRAAEERADGFVSKAELRDRLPKKLEELFPGFTSSVTTRH